MKNNGSSGTVTTYVAGVAAASLTLAMWSGSNHGIPAGLSWPIAPLLCLLVAAEYLILRFRYREEVMGLNLFEAILLPSIFALDPIVVAGMAAIAQAVASIVRKNPPVKAIFNAAQWSLAAGAGAVVYHVTRSGPELDGRNVIALILAMAVVVAINTIAFSLVVVLAQRQRFMAVLNRLAPSILVGWPVNTAFGLLFVATYAWTPAGLALAVVPLLSLHHAHKGYAAAVNDKARLAGLHRASQVLAASLDPHTAIPQFLTEVLSSFGSEAVELVLVESGGRRAYRVTGAAPGASTSRVETEEVRSLAAALMGHETIRVTAATTDLELADLLRREGWRDCLAAPLAADGRTLGVLCAYNRSGLEGFEDGELAVIQALAGEAAAMINKGSLLDAIIEERRKLAEIVSRASDGIMTVAVDGSIQAWNPSMVEITGYDTAEMVGARYLGELRPRDADGADVMLEHWADADGDPPADIQIVTREGEVRWLSCSYTRVADPDGRPHLLIAVARDVTRLREIEQLKDDFVATVSHELRTPLTPIRGWASTLMDHGEKLGPVERQIAAESIHRQAEHLERLITNLLEASRIEPGGHVQRDAVVDVISVARKVVDEFRAARPDRIIRLEEPQRACAVLGDDLWIERILSNLVSNAVKYSPAPEPVEVRITRDGEDVEIHVVDRGRGIAARDIEKIFERFRRLGAASTRAEGGAGLGLYIARQLAGAIGGSIDVQSRLREGSTFVLRLRPAGRLAAVS